MVSIYTGMRDFLDVFLLSCLFSLYTLYSYTATLSIHIFCFLVLSSVREESVAGVLGRQGVHDVASIGAMHPSAPSTGYSWRKTWHIPMIGSVWKPRRELSLSLLHLQ